MCDLSTSDKIELEKFIYIILVCPSVAPSISYGQLITWNASATYIDGDEVDYVCNPLFTPWSNGIMRCTFDGTWSPGSSHCIPGKYYVSIQ